MPAAYSHTQWWLLLHFCAHTGQATMSGALVPIVSTAASATKWWGCSKLPFYNQTTAARVPAAESIKQHHTHQHMLFATLASHAQCTQ
jgi:hypothetical protein